MTTTQFMWRMMRFRPWLFLVNCTLWACFHSLPLLVGLALQWFFDVVTNHAHTHLWVFLPLAFFAAARFVRIANFFAGFYAWTTFWYHIEALLRKNMLAGILRWPGRNLPASPGEAISRFRDDVQEVIDYLESWTDFWGRLIYFVVSIVVMLRISWTITLAAVLPLILVAFFNNLSGRRARKYGKANREATGRITGFIGDVFGAVLAVKVGGAESNVLRRFQMLNESRRRAALKDNLFKEWMRSLSAHVLNISTGAILLMGAAAMRNGQFTVGDFALFTSYLTYFSFSVSLFGYMIFQHKRLRVSLDRMIALFQGDDAPQLTAHGPVYLNQEAPAASIPVLRPKDRLHTLEVKGLSYHYPHSKHGVFNIDLRLRSGSFTVITGRIGSGKSTLLRVLLGLLPLENGEIRWNGEVVEEPARFFVPPRSAYTPQVPRLFSDSLRENLLLGRPDDPQKLAAVIGSAVMEQDLAQLDNGLEAFVGPRGVMLSGGQVQRAATARMLMTESELLVFDDLSSALDVDTERTLWNRLFQSQNATCLAVSHRRTALRRADHIIVMRDGRVDDEGKLPDLLTRCPEMQALWYGEPEDDDALEAIAEEIAK